METSGMGEEKEKGGRDQEKQVLPLPEMMMYEDENPYPVGFCFRPTELELVLYYLERRMSPPGLPIADDGLVVDYDIYLCNPWDLPRHLFKFHKMQPEMFFFSPRHPTKTKSKKSSSIAAARFNRTAGKGFWHGYGKDNLIHRYDGRRRVVVGHETAFQFKVFLNGKNKDGQAKKTNWIMHEYRHHKLDHLVLCKIYEKKRSNANREDDWDGTAALAPLDDDLQEEEPQPQLRCLKRRRVEEPPPSLLPICPPPPPPPSAPVDDIQLDDDDELLAAHLEASLSSSPSLPPLVSWEGEGKLAPSTSEKVAAKTPAAPPPKDVLDFHSLFLNVSLDGLPPWEDLPLLDERGNLPLLDASCNLEELASFFSV